MNVAPVRVVGVMPLPDPIDLRRKQTVNLSDRERARRVPFDQKFTVAVIDPHRVGVAVHIEVAHAEHVALGGGPGRNENGLLALIIELELFVPKHSIHRALAESLDVSALTLVGLWQDECIASGGVIHIFSPCLSFQRGRDKECRPKNRSASGYRQF